MVRRVFAVATTLSVLHLSFVGGDLACATHGRPSAASPIMHHAAPRSHEDSMHHASPHSESSDCPVPSQSHCCDLLAACGLAFAVGPAVERVTARSTASVDPGSNATRLISRSRAPEPPPPKA